MYLWRASIAFRCSSYSNGHLTLPNHFHDVELADAMETNVIYFPLQRGCDDMNQSFRREFSCLRTCSHDPRSYNYQTACVMP